MAAAINSPNRMRNAASDAMSTGLVTRRSRAACRLCLGELITVARSEGDRHTERAGQVRFAEHLQSPRLLVRIFDRRPVPGNYVFLRSADGLDRRDRGFKHALRSFRQGCVQVFQIGFQSCALCAAIKLLRALQQRGGALTGGAAGTAFDAVELPRNGGMELQDEIDALLGNLPDAVAAGGY